jgi:D-glycero-alpha-D-manno-heptose-7-phosphate kinase
MIVRAKAPFRLEFAGGGTDVPPFPDDHGGLIFNATIDHFAHCSITPRLDNELNVHSLDYNIIARFTEDDQMEYNGNLDLVKAVFKRMAEFNPFKEKGLDIILYSDIPAGSGLGSSSTVCVALVGALATYYRVPLSKSEIASLAYQIERIDLGITGGLQDQYAAAFGGFNLMEFQKDLKVLVNPLNIPRDTRNELLYHLVLINTGEIRMSDGILRDQIGTYQQMPEKVLKHYLANKEIAVQMKNELIAGTTKNFGRLLTTAWQHKKQVSEKISNEKIELLYQTAMDRGAIGGRIMGAGGGGHMIFYVDDIVKRRPLLRALEALGAKHVPYSFDDMGLQTWLVKD